MQEDVSSTLKEVVYYYVLFLFCFVYTLCKGGKDPRECLNFKI